MQRVTITGAVVSGQEVRVQGYYSASGDWRPIAVNASGELPISVSVTAAADISGQAVWVSSGEVVAQISGQPVSISGQPVQATVTVSEVSVSSGEIHIMSGEVEIKPLEDVVVGSLVTVPSTSGGITLGTQAINSLTIKSLSKNSGDIYIGGNTTGSMPYSGYGLLLEPGEAVNLDIHNLNTVRVYATISGDKITYLGLSR